ncbi:hypothetical protein ACLB2K_050638 [Fragaria x ananassa]
MLEASSASTMPEEGYSSLKDNPSFFLWKGNPLYETSAPTEVSSHALISQSVARSSESCDSDSDNVQVLMASLSCPEEQLKQQMEELTKKLAQLERDALQRQIDREIEAKRIADIESESRRRVAEKEVEVAELVAKCAALMENRHLEPSFVKGDENSLSPERIRNRIAEGIRDFQLSLSRPILG